jgi:hypothetical protein
VSARTPGAVPSHGKSSRPFVHRGARGQGRSGKPRARPPRAERRPGTCGSGPGQAEDAIRRPAGARPAAETRSRPRAAHPRNLELPRIARHTSLTSPGHRTTTWRAPTLSDPGQSLWLPNQTMVARSFQVLLQPPSPRARAPATCLPIYLLPRQRTSRSLRSVFAVAAEREIFFF